MTSVEIKSRVVCFGGEQIQFSHASDACQCDMTASIYLPPQAAHAKVPVLWWLSGLTCTDQNFVTKAGAQRYAARAWRGNCHAGHIATRRRCAG